MIHWEKKTVTILCFTELYDQLTLICFVFKSRKDELLVGESVECVLRHFCCTICEVLRYLVHEDYHRFILVVELANEDFARLTKHFNFNTICFYFLVLHLAAGLNNEQEPYQQWKKIHSFFLFTSLTTIPQTILYLNRPYPHLMLSLVCEWYGRLRYRVIIYWPIRGRYHFKNELLDTKTHVVKAWWMRYEN